MVKVSRSALLMYSSDEMYRLVNDVHAYPEFLPGCIATNIISNTDNIMHASVKVSKAGISQTFTTKNTLVESRSIVMNLVDGPFTHLTGNWTFTELDAKACKVNLDLQFEFSNTLAGIAFGRVFKELAGVMVKSFATRAKVVYGVR